MKRSVKRSCHGCARCKRRRQKCDEQKPTCGRCADAGVSCEYRIVLKWNGRVPRDKNSPREGKDSPSTFSTLADNNVGLQCSLADLANQEGRLHSRLSHWLSPIQQPYSTLSPTANLLLHHFITEASMISSHADIRNQICRDILPMAYQSESLLYATMAFSALHRSTLLNELPDQFVPEDLVSELILASMYCLRRDLETPGHPTQPLLHTIRTLCHCEIYSGRANSSWRVHVKGAGAMFSAVASRRDLDHSEYSFWLWSRWFWSIQALTAVTDVGTLSELSLEVPAMQENHEDYFFDTYTGYSSDLNIVLVQIGAMAQKKAIDNTSGGETPESSTFHYLEKACELESTIRAMIQRDNDIGLKFPSHVVLDKNTVRQFEACNTAYQNAGLIHLYRRLRNMPTVSEEVQGCVRTILDAVYAILPITTLSPWILLTTPIYTAGCEAVGQDRDLVKDLLLGLYSTLRIRNILRAIEILNHNWRVTDKFRNIQQRISGKDSRKRICDVTGTLDFLDFIPY